MVRSPNITIKPETRFISDLIDVKQLPHGLSDITWPKMTRYDAMIYFLVVEDDQRRSLAGIYTRDTKWRYPLTKQASLSVGNFRPPNLVRDKQYRIRLVVVDYDGWVSARSDRTFIYNL